MHNSCTYIHLQSSSTANNCKTLAQVLIVIASHFEIKGAALKLKLKPVTKPAIGKFTMEHRQ